MMIKNIKNFIKYENYKSKYEKYKKKYLLLKKNLIGGDEIQYKIFFDDEEIPSNKIDEMYFEDDTTYLELAGEIAKYLSGKFNQQIYKEDLIISIRREENGRNIKLSKGELERSIENNINITFSLNKEIDPIKNAIKEQRLNMNTGQEFFIPNYNIVNDIREASATNIDFNNPIIEGNIDNGKGNIRLNDGIEIDGDFSNVKYLKGIITYPSGKIEKGIFLNYILIEGERSFEDFKLEGFFKDGILVNGRISDNDHFDEGTFDDYILIEGKRVVDDFIFEGKFDKESRGLIQGRVIRNDNIIYEGELKDGRPHGRGKYFKNDSKLEGTFENGELIDGKILYYDDIHEGKFENENLIKGTKNHFSEQILEEGTFEKGYLVQGKKTFLDSNNEIEEGKFKDGFLVEGKAIINGNILVGTFYQGRLINGTRTNKKGKTEKVNIDLENISENFSMSDSDSMLDRSGSSMIDRSDSSSELDVNQSALKEEMRKYIKTLKNKKK